MRFSTPLAKMTSNLDMREPQMTLEHDQHLHLQAQQREERASRMISEELFYVDFSSDVDFDTKSRNQGHPGGVPLEIIARAMAAGELPKVGFESSDVDTEAVSSRRSSEDTDDSWRFRKGIHDYPETLHETAAAAATAAADILTEQSESHPSQRFPVPTANWERDFPRYGQPQAQRRTGDGESISESQLKIRALQQLLCKPAHDEEIEDWLVAWSIHNSAAKEALIASPAETSASAPAVASSSREEACETGGTDPCAAMLHGLQRAWNSLTGQRGSGDSRVVYICRHRNSCTSFKTFDNFKPNVGILRRLDVVPDTYAMHIAQFRVVSTIWGQHAEYEVRVKAGSRRWICWHRFSRFKLFAATIAEVNHSCANAWGRVVTFQPSHRCLDQEYLAYKCRLLEEFLTQVMFAIPTPAPLIWFVIQQ